MGELADITPPSEPISLARGMVVKAPGCAAAVAVLVQDDGTMWFDCCGHHRKDILWALQKMIFELMLDGDLGD